MPRIDGHPNSKRESPFQGFTLKTNVTILKPNLFRLFAPCLISVSKTVLLVVITLTTCKIAATEKDLNFNPSSSSGPY